MIKSSSISLLRRNSNLAIALSALVVLFAAFVAIHPRGLSTYVLTIWFNQGTLLSLAAIAQFFVVLVRGVDLSVGPIVALTNVAASYLLVGSPGAIALGAAAVVALGVTCGFAERSHRGLWAHPADRRNACHRQHDLRPGAAVATDPWWKHRRKPVRCTHLRHLRHTDLGTPVVRHSHRADRSAASEPLWTDIIRDRICRIVSSHDRRAGRSGQARGLRSEWRVFCARRAIRQHGHVDGRSRRSALPTP